MCVSLLISRLPFSFFFFFNDTATTEIYTLSLHDALPIWVPLWQEPRVWSESPRWPGRPWSWEAASRSEEHTSELQSLAYLVCRLLLEKKKKQSTLLVTKQSAIAKPHVTQTCKSIRRPYST